MKHPKISVVMPVYNVEKYIGEAILSVLAQSFTDFELLIIDDGGNDNSMTIAASIQDERIRIITQENRGLAGARNTGILAARGEYIALLDSDDRWHRDKLSLHVIHLDNNDDVGVSYSGSRFIDADGNPLKKSQKPKLTDITSAHIFMRNPIGNGSAPVIRKSALDNVAFIHPNEPTRLCFFDESFRQSEDIEMWSRMTLSANIKFEGIKGLLTEYRLLPGALSANLIAQYESWNRMMEKVKGINPAFAQKWESPARAYQLRYLARRAVQLGDTTMALLMMRKATQENASAMIKEPSKSITTWAAALLMKFLPHQSSQGLLNAWTGTASGTGAMK